MKKPFKTKKRAQPSHTASIRLENQFGPEIPNSFLRESDLPASAAEVENTWNQFALTFDGYAHWGSTDKCGEIANHCAEVYYRSRVLPESLMELRTCLFFEQRRWHHFGTEISPESMTYIQALIAAIRTNLKAGPTPE